MKRTILIFGGVTAAILLLYQLSTYSMLSQGPNSNLFIGLAGLLFILTGFVLSKFIQKGRKSSEESTIDARALKKSKLSGREYEILTLIGKGLSNQEIGSHLFISENTVKTHVSNILVKLNAKRRTQAIQIARDLNII